MEEPKNLYQAAVAGNLDKVRYFLDRGDLIDKPELLSIENGRSVREKTPLHAAAFYGHREVVGLLLARGANLHKTDTFGNTALHLAAKNGKEEVVKLLLGRGADIDRVDKHGESGLHKAAAGGQVGMVNCFLEHGADTRKVNNSGKTAYDLALSNTGPASAHDRVKVLARLLDYDDFVLEQATGTSLVDHATSVKDAVLLSCLLAYGAYAPTRKSRTAGRQILDILEKDAGYIDEKALGSRRKGSPRPRFRNGRLNTSKKLEKALSKAICGGNLPLVRSTLGQNKKLLNENVLLEGCRWGYLGIVEYLLHELNPPANPPEVKRCTPLHEAARRGHRRIVKLLLARGTPTDIRNEAGETPLHDAAKWGKWPTVVLLIKHGARVTVTNKDGQTPLDLAEHHGWREVIEILRSPCMTFSARSNKLVSLQEIFDGVVQGNIYLDEALIKRVFLPENVRGIRDLWAGHKLLEIAKRLGKLPEEMNGFYLMRKFYHKIIGKLYSEQEINMAQKILKSAEDQELLCTGGASATLGDVETVGYISETLAPVIFDLNLRIQGLEKGFNEVRSAILQIKQAHRQANKHSLYLAFLRLGLSFIPIAGGVLGTGVDVIGRALDAIEASGVELGDLCGPSTAVIDALDPLLTHRGVSTDLEELDSLKQRLSPQFLDALPGRPRNTFLNLVKECLTGGIDELRHVLDELLKEVAQNKNFLKLKETEALEAEGLQEGEPELISQAESEAHVNGQVPRVEEQKNDTESGHENDSSMTVALKRSKTNGSSRCQETLRLQRMEETMSLIGALHIQISEIERRIQRAASVGGAEEVSGSSEILKDVQERMDGVLNLLSKYSDGENAPCTYDTVARG